MRIVLVNGGRRKIGGVETYLEALILALETRGDQVACMFEAYEMAKSDSIQIPKGVPAWYADPPNRGVTLQALEAWKPDIVVLHRPIDLGLKSSLLSIAPGVFFAHNYYGTCISGTKRHAFPGSRPCHKVFSAACLAHYLPRRCGGLNPITMIQRYNSERIWLNGLREFAAIVVASECMASEYRKHGFGSRVKVVGLPVRNYAAANNRRLPFIDSEPIRLLFVGRMENYKGGMMLLRALPDAKRNLQQSIHLTFAGGGRERRRWEAHSKMVMNSNPGIEVEFAGWLSGATLKEATEASHLLVLPSVWPEPFGLVGLEAGVFGLPTAAFDVGGISDWLKDGVNGHLAPGNPPTAWGLAKAIHQSVSNHAHYIALRAGAQASLAHFTMDKHLDKLVPILEQTCASIPPR